ncbi:hypothetical protein [Streptomyces sp. enrichment culture]|uniref:hypothetical protein n=1 Tax=Streptomyces sp. enrichment culture TaxID=1795815 RepID=UPI003F562FFF
MDAEDANTSSSSSRYQVSRQKLAAWLTGDIAVARGLLDEPGALRACTNSEATSTESRLRPTRRITSWKRISAWSA